MAVDVSTKPALAVGKPRVLFEGDFELSHHDYGLLPDGRHFVMIQRRIGFQANRRLLQVQRISHDCILAEEAFQKINHPVQVTSQRASALRFADPKVPALWRALLLFQLLPTGFSNRHLVQHFASLLGQPPDSLTQGQMTYHLRRLRLHGILERIPQTHRYRITDLGLRTAWFCSRTYSRILCPGSDPYCRSSRHPTPRSGAASTNLIRRLHLGSNTQN
jgi:hypothetical protein